jgi:hypothetical protein
MSERVMRKGSICGKTPKKNLEELFASGIKRVVNRDGNKSISHPGLLALFRSGTACHDLGRGTAGD